VTGGSPQTREARGCRPHGETIGHFIPDELTKDRAGAQPLPWKLWTNMTYWVSASRPPKPS
jgi:hypothetical protein